MWPTSASSGTSSGPWLKASRLTFSTLFVGVALALAAEAERGEAGLEPVDDLAGSGAGSSCRSPPGCAASLPAVLPPRSRERPPAQLSEVAGGRLRARMMPVLHHLPVRCAVLFEEEASGMSQPLPYCVYVLRSQKDGDLYVGYTTDLPQRLQQHNNGENRSTAPWTPARLGLLRVLLVSRGRAAAGEVLEDESRVGVH